VDSKETSDELSSCLKLEHLMAKQHSMKQSVTHRHEAENILWLEIKIKIEYQR